MFKDNEYIVIQGWMLNKLNLKGNDLLVYALIYRYSQDGEHKFYGSLQYLADWTNSTIKGVQNNLKNLLEAGFIFKNKLGDSKNSPSEYWINTSILENSNESQKDNNIYKNDYMKQSSIGMEQSSNNINNYNKIKNNLFISKDINKQVVEVLQTDIYFSKNRTSKSYKVLQTWLSLYIDDLEIRSCLMDWLSIMYSNKKIANLECLKNKVDYLNNNLRTKEEKIAAIKDATDKLWFTFQYSVEKVKKNSYNIQSNYVNIEKNNEIELSDEVF